MIWRTILLFTMSGAFVAAQSPAVQGVFIQQAAEIARRVTDADQARAEMRRNLGISAEGVAAIFAIGQEYSDAAEKIEQTLRSGLSRRNSQRAGTTLLPADVLYDNAWRQMDALAGQKLKDLKDRLSAEDYDGVLRYMRENPDLSFFPYRATTSATKPSLLQSPKQVWLSLVRGPLSRPKDGDRLFVQNYMGAVLPPPDSVRYLVGQVVAVEPGRVLLSMEQNGQADAALLFDGQYRKLNSAPAVGTTVQFTGQIVDWKSDPFLMTFSPDRLVGLDAETPLTKPPRR